MQRKLQGFVDSGQLGVFGSGYWGHPAMKLPPEVNLMAVAHYMQALDYQRRANQIVGVLGSKTPHIQNLAVGGVANPINPNSQSTLTLERLYKVKALIDEAGRLRQSGVLARCRGHRRALRRLDAVRRRRHHLPRRSGHAARHQEHAVRAARRLHPGRRSGRLPAARRLSGRLLRKGRPRRAASMLGTATPARRCIRTTARPSRSIRASRTRRSIPGSRRRPSTTNGRRSARWPMCWRCTLPATSRRSATWAGCWRSPARSPAPRSRYRPCTRRSAGTPPAPSAAPCLPKRWMRSGRLLMENIAKGDFATFNRPTFPKGEIRGFGCARGAARRAVSLGGHPRWQDRQLSGRRSEHLERRPARCHAMRWVRTKHRWSAIRSPIPRSR